MSHLLASFKKMLRQFLSRVEDWSPADAPIRNRTKRILDGCYHLFDFKPRKKNRVIVYMTDTSEHCGLADRLRTMRTAYVLAKENGRDLYIYHNKGFKLEDYLEPNEVDWRIEEKEISFGLNRICFVIFYKKLPQILYPKREYHLYAAHCLVNTCLPDELKGKYSDYSVFWKMFKLSKYLDSMVQAVMSEKGLLENKYIVAHCRFLNFFEQVEVNGADPATKEEQQKMIAAVNLTIEKLFKSSNCEKILLFSDSNIFLQAEHPPYVEILPGEVRHVSRQNNSQAADKAFLDLIVMSRAKAIYSIIGDNLYTSGFPRDASFIGNKPFRRVNVEKI